MITCYFKSTLTTIIFSMTYNIRRYPNRAIVRVYGVLVGTFKDSEAPMTRMVPVQKMKEKMMGDEEEE